MPNPPYTILSSKNCVHDKIIVENPCPAKFHKNCLTVAVHGEKSYKTVISLKFSKKVNLNVGEVRQRAKSVILVVRGV